MQEKILIVDDEPGIVVPLQFLMEQKGYQVRVALTGEDAVESLLSFQPDLVLLDIMLPVLNGFEVCRLIRENPLCRHTRIIFLSALGRDADIAKGMAIGADAYIIKPFSNSEIVEKVKELLHTPNEPE